MKAREKKLLDFAAVIGAVIDIDEMRRVALEMLRELVWFDRGTFWVLDPLTGLPQGPPVLINLPIQLINTYQDYGGLSSDVARQAGRAQNKLIARSTDVIDYREWTRHEVFNHLYRPHGGYYQLGCDIEEKRQTFGAIALLRYRGSGDFREEDVQILRYLHPHLLNRLRWHHLLESNRQFAYLKNTLPTYGILLASLTDREQEIVKLVLTGSANWEIAARLGISINTVKMHLQNIFNKLGISRRSQLSALYMGYLLLETGEENTR